MVFVMKKVRFSFDEDCNLVVSYRQPITGSYENIAISLSNLDYIYNAYFLMSVEYRKSFFQALSILRNLDTTMQAYCADKPAK